MTMHQDVGNAWMKEMDLDVVLLKSMLDVSLVERWWLTDKTKIFTNTVSSVLNTVAISTILLVEEESSYNCWKIEEMIVK